MMNPTLFEIIIAAIISLTTLFLGRYWGLHDRRISHDTKILEDMLNIIPSNQSIRFIREHDFGGSFNIDELDDFLKFIEFSKRPEFHFLNRKIEKLRIHLVKNTQELISFSATNIFPRSNAGKNIVGMKQAHEYRNDNEYKRIRENINHLADQVCDRYDNLIISASKKGIYTK